MNPADYISRHLQGSKPCDLIADRTEHYVNYVVSQAKPKALSMAETIGATAQDSTLQAVMKLISSGKWDDVKPEHGDISTLNVFANVSNELTSVNGKDYITWYQNSHS